MPVLAALVLLAWCGPSCGGTAAFDSAMVLALQRSLDDAVAEEGIVGAAMAVRAPDGSTWSGASGLAILPGEAGMGLSKDAAAGTPMTTGMHFHIASTTKSLTATMILQLVDEGKLSLDETLDQIVARWFLPGYVDFAVPYGDAITLRNILQMRSGMVDYLATEEGATRFAQRPLESIDPREMLRVGAESVDPAPYAPGTRMEYCNTNFIWQGVIIEQVTGNAFAEEARRRLFIPLGLGETSVPDSAAMPAPYAHGYLPVDGQVADRTESFDPSYGWAAGAIISTVGDMVDWVTALNDGTLLSSAIQAQRMIMESGEIETWPVLYGLGVYDDGGAVGHYGNYNSFYTSYAMRYAGYDVAVLTNGLLVAHDEPGWHAAREVFWRAVGDAGIAR